MADNGSECVTYNTESQRRMINITYTSLSILSFVIGLIAMFLNRCYYCCYKGQHQTDSMEEIFTVITAICCILEFFDSFQWFALFDDFVGCTVLGAVREYAIISLLVILFCFGTHLLILMTKPKCLQVINELKFKRFKIIQKIYAIVSFLVPIIFVPWPFISVQYGKDEYLCWLRNSGCNDSGISYILSRVLMWYMWALLVWVFTVAAFAISFYTYCSHKRSTTLKLDVNIVTIISLLTVSTVYLLVNFLWGLIQKRNSFPLTFFFAVNIPLTVMIVFIILITRHVCIKKKASQRSKEIVLTEVQMSAGTYQIAIEGEPISRSTYYVQPKDDWDT